MSDSDHEMEVEEKKVVEDCSEPTVVTKYRLAGDIVNAALQAVKAAVVPGASVVEVCQQGDDFILAQTAKIFNKGKVDKGLGFPTCLSINNVVGHFSPLAKDETVIQAGDLVKIDLGVHIDGYVAVGAHTVVVSPEGPITGRQADVIAAAQTAAEAAIRLLKPGNKSSQITEVIAKVAKEFKVEPVLGVQSHELTRFIIDGKNVIQNRADPENKTEEVEFAPHQAYGIDIVISSGEGKPKEVDERTTVYKRDATKTYNLKRKASRFVYSEVQKRFTTFPFTIRAFGETQVKFGIKECAQHELVSAYPILHEKEGEFVAHIKFTALLLPNNTIRITGLPAESVQSEYSVQDEELKNLLATSIGKKKRRKKNKKKAAPSNDMDTSN